MSVYDSRIGKLEKIMENAEAIGDTFSFDEAYSEWYRLKQIAKVNDDSQSMSLPVVGFGG